MADRRDGRLVVIGVDGLSWSDCGPPEHGGTMPQLVQLGKAGILAPLVGAEFGYGPAFWTTLATGLPPEEHGIFFPDEARGEGRLPVSRRSWQARPWWEAAHEQGRVCASVAWPANAPAASLPGHQIDDRIADASGPDHDRWALPLGCASASIRAALRDRRIHPTDVDPRLIARFVTDIAAIDQHVDPWLPRIAVALARAATVQAAAVWALAESDASVVVVHQPWLRDMRSAFEPAHAPEFAPAVPTALAFLDDMIARLTEAAGPDATVILLSPNRGRNPGIMLATGPGAGRAGAAPIKVGDVVPTILGHLGLIDDDLPGRALPFLTQHPPMHAVTIRQTKRGPAPALPFDPRLAAADYRPPPPPPPAWRAKRSAILALAILPRAPAKAAALTREALQLDPDCLPALYGATLAAIDLRDPGALAGVADAFDRIAPNNIWGALARAAENLLRDERSAAIAALPRASIAADPETLAHLAALWLLAGQPAEARQIYARLLTLDPLDLRAALGAAACDAEMMAYAKAEQRLYDLRNRLPFEPQVYHQLHAIYRATGRAAEAERMLRIAQSIDG